jgi:peroxiredoxin
MKKRITLMLFCILIIAILYLISIVVLRKNHSREKLKSFITTLPNINFNDIRGDTVNNTKLLGNTPSVFVAFNPECEHCQYEAKSINERYNDLQNLNLIMFTIANDSMTKAFSKQYGLDSLKNIRIISDTTKEMEKIFDVKTIPTVFIYNAQNQLVKRYNGETKIEAILKNLQ